MGNGRTIELVSGYDNATTLTNANSVEFNLSAGFRDIGAYEFRGNSNDFTPPTISATSPSVISNQGLTAEPISQIQLSLSEQVNLIDTGASVYELRSAGVNNTFDNGDDVIYSLTRQYNPQSATITLGIQNAGQPLPAGRYRLTVISNANTSIHDLSGNLLDGDGNGTPGGNFVRTFRFVNNSAPVLSGSYNLPPINEDASLALNEGTTVANVLAGRVTDANGPATGMAIVAINDSNGVWQYTVNGTHYAPIAPQVAAGKVLLLSADSNTRIRFVPNANYFGTVGGLTYRAWDGADENPEGTSILPSLILTRSLSDAVEVSSITVNPINDAPTNILISNNSVREKLAAGTSIGLLSVTDIELSDTHTLELAFGTGSTDNDRFVIVGNELRLAETLDFELQPTHSIRVRATDNGGLSVEKQMTISVINMPVRATGLFVRGSGWNASYLAMLASNNLGTVSGGFKLIDGPNQLANSSLVTWQTINQISATFDEDSVINPIALRLLDGANLDVPLAVNSFSYDTGTRTAKWTLANSIPTGRYLISLESAMIADGAGAKLDAEWSTSSDVYATSGDDVAGGDLNFLFNYLQGDMTRNGQTNPGDVNLLRSLGTITPDATNYWRDVTGNNQINPGDVNYVRSLGTVVLPTNTPTIPPPPRSPLVSARGHRTSVDPSVLKLSAKDLSQAVGLATQQWAISGITQNEIERLGQVQVEVADLSPSPYLGMSSENRILIDDDAAGWGWSFDTDMNATSNVQGATRPSMDLLTAVLHELGHQLGFEDDHDSSDDDTLMDWSLDLDEVRIPIEAHPELTRPELTGNVANQLQISESWPACVDDYFSEWENSNPRKRRTGTIGR